MDKDPKIETTMLAETANYLLWKAQEPDGEETFHLELGTATLHFFAEEWQELVELVKAVE
jgi:hypothetical protein